MLGIGSVNAIDLTRYAESQIENAINTAKAQGEVERKKLSFFRKSLFACHFHIANTS